MASSYFSSARVAREKRTILKLLYMEEKPSTARCGSTGSIRTPQNEARSPQLRRKLGIVFQEFRLLEDRTAEQNVAFALEVTGAPKTTIPAKVARALNQVGLASKARRPAATSFRR